MENNESIVLRATRRGILGTVLETSFYFIVAVCFTAVVCYFCKVGSETEATSVPTPAQCLIVLSGLAIVVLVLVVMFIHLTPRLINGWFFYQKAKMVFHLNSDGKINVASLIIISVKGKLSIETPCSQILSVSTQQSWMQSFFNAGSITVEFLRSEDLNEESCVWELDGVIDPQLFKEKILQANPSW